MSYDSELLQRYADEGSEAAFAELVERNVAMVYAAAARQVADTDAAKDVVQTVFVDLARKARSLRRHPALLSWLFASTRYAARNVVRANLRRRRREIQAYTMHDLGASAADADWLRLRPLLDEALCALRDRERETILLHYFRGLPFAEIGQAFGIQESAARKSASRALEKLHETLKRRGIESTSTALSVALANSLSATAPTGLSSAASIAALATSSATPALLPALAGATIGTKVCFGIGAILLLAGIAYTTNHTSGTAQEFALPSTEPSVGAPRASTAVAHRSSGQTKTDGSVTNGRPADAAFSLTRTTGSQRAAKHLSSEQQFRQAVRREERQAARREARRIEKIVQSTERRLAPLFATVDFTPEERRRLTELVTNEHEAAIDYAAANARAGRDITSSPEEYFDAGWMLRADLLAQIKTLLGEDRYAAFLANDLASRQAAVVEHMQRRLSTVNESLTESQIQGITALLKQAHTFAVHEDTVAAAQKLLSPAQLDALKAEQAKQQAGVMKPPVQRAIRENLSPATAR